MSVIYHNPTTNQTAKVNSTQADPDGKVWVEIDSGVPVQMDWDDFIKNFCFGLLKEIKK